MNVTIQEEGNNYVVIFNGRLDTAAASKVEKEMQPLHDIEDHDFILDCSQLEYISSSGLRIFLSLLKAVKPKGSHVFITGMSDTLRQIFAMTGFTNLFEFK